MTVEEIVRSTVRVVEGICGSAADVVVYLYNSDLDALVAQSQTLSLRERVLARTPATPAWRAQIHEQVVQDQHHCWVPMRAALGPMGVLCLNFGLGPEFLEQVLMVADAAGGALGQERLRRDVDRQTALLDIVSALSDEGLVIAAAGSGELLKVNRRMEELCGWTQAELQARGWFECLYPDPDARARAVVSVRAAFHGAPAEGVPWRITHRDGHPVDTILRSRAITLDGPSSFIVGMFRDVTAERERKGEELRTARYEELGRLAAAVAHDFNNLVAAVQGHAELLATRYEGEVGERAQVILSTVSRATTLTQQLVTFGRDQPVLLVPTDVGLVCRDVVTTFQENVRNIQIELDLAADCPAADLDAQSFSQLLLNLLRNARDASGAWGKVRIEVGRAEPPLRPLRRWGSTKRIGWVRVRVRDDGPGLPPGIREHLFEPFFTTKPSGHGLGLAAVARIAEAHGAVLDAPHLEDRGAVFDVYLPIASRPMVAAAMRKDPDAAGTERIWVVDDDEAVREYLVAALGAFGYEVRGFGGPLQTLQAVDGGESYELLVTDVSMPGMDGLELHLALRARGIRRPVMFCSGYSERAASVPSGHDVDFMQKPLSMRALAQRVRRLLNYTLPESLTEAG